MGTADIQTKEYMADPARFADAFNYAIYGGREMLQESELIPMDATSVATPFGAGGKTHVQRHRDVLRLWQAMRDDRAIYAVLGIENQTDVHYAMPVRGMLYDAMSYVAQVSGRKRARRKRRMSGPEFLSEFGKDDRLRPVVTLVIHFGSDEWDGPMSLHEMLDVHDSELLALVPDYRINLIDPFGMEDEEFREFHTGLGPVLGYIKHAEDSEALSMFVEGDERFRSMDVQSARLINAITDSQITIGSEEGEVDMCQAIKDMRTQSYKSGQEDGAVRTLYGLMEDGILTLEQAALRAGMDIDEFQAICAELRLT